MKNTVDLTEKEKQQFQQLCTCQECLLIKKVYEAKKAFRAILEQKIDVNKAKNKLMSG